MGRCLGLVADLSSARVGRAGDLEGGVFGSFTFLLLFAPLFALQGPFRTR